MQHEIDLEYVSTTALVDELRRRYDGGALFLIKDLTVEDEQSFFRFWGGSRAVACAVALRRKVVRAWEKTARDPGLEY